MSPRKKVYLLGAHGFLGRNLVRQWADCPFDVVPVLRQGSSFAGALNPATLGQALENSDPSLVFGVINCAALADLAACDRDEARSYESNVALALEVGTLAKRFGVPLIQISTDGLFGQGAHRRSAPAYWKVTEAAPPASNYGKHKLMAEKGLHDLNWGLCIRLSFVGPSLGTQRGLVHYLAQQARKKLAVTSYTDNWFSPVHVDQLADKIAERLQRSGGIPTGFSIEHWGSATATSKGEFLEQVASLAGVQLSFIHATRGPGPWPLDQTLACDQSWPLEELIELSARSLSEELQALEGSAQS